MHRFVLLFVSFRVFRFGKALFVFCSFLFVFSFRQAAVRFFPFLFVFFRFGKALAGNKSEQQCFK